MPLTYALLMLSPVVPPVPACERLLTEFYKNENTFTLIHETDNNLLNVERRFAASTGDNTGVEKQLIESRRDDNDFLATGDRILATLTSLACPVPDHMTSWQTFETQKAECAAARNTPDQADRCGYVAQAVQDTLSRPKGGVTTHRRR